MSSPNAQCCALGLIPWLVWLVTKKKAHWKQEINFYSKKVGFMSKWMVTWGISKKIDKLKEKKVSQGKQIHNNVESKERQCQFWNDEKIF